MASVRVSTASDTDLAARWAARLISRREGAMVMPMAVPAAQAGRHPGEKPPAAASSSVHALLTPFCVMSCCLSVPPANPRSGIQPVPFYSFPFCGKMRC